MQASTLIDDIAVPYLTFQLGELQYALAIADVVEVAAMVEPLPLAAAPIGVVGMANRHGEPILLVDLQTMLNLLGKSGDQQSLSTTKYAYDVNTLFIVVQPEKTSTASRFAILVDSVNQVEYFTPSARTELLHSRNHPIQAVISVEDRMIQLLDLSQLVQVLSGKTSGMITTTQQHGMMTGQGSFGPAASASFDRPTPSDNLQERK